MRTALLAATLLLAGCTDAPPPRAVPTATPATTPAASASPTPSPSLRVLIESEPAHFSTPTKNIGCYVAPDGLSCEIFEHRWPLPSKPADCDADWGPGLSISTSGAVEVGHCASDTVLSAERILPYGTAVRVGAFRCASERVGVTCTHDTTRHGFFLSRDRYRIF